MASKHRRTSNVADAVLVPWLVDQIVLHSHLLHRALPPVTAAACVHGALALPGDVGRVNGGWAIEARLQLDMDAPARDQPTLLNLRRHVDDGLNGIALLQNTELLVLSAAAYELHSCRR